MASKFDNRVKLKVWRNGGTMEYDGGVAEGLYYAGWNLTVAERDELIQKLGFQQEKAKETAA
jgi:hypothetical protein